MKCILFGAGKVCAQYYDIVLKISAENDIHIVDSNPSVWGKRKILGKEVESPTIIKENTYDKVIITSHKYTEEINRLLIENYDVPEYKIVRPNMIAYIDPVTFNIGNMKFLPSVHKKVVFNKHELCSMIDPESMNDLEKFAFYENRKGIFKWLHYFEQYERFFSKFKNKDVTILEIGVYKGGSLEMWKNYFQSEDNTVKIYGIDIDSNCKQFEEENIHIFIGSQGDPEFLKQVKQQIGSLDVIIDDGAHTMNEQIVSFEELFDLLNDGGIYLCEDLHTSYEKEYGCHFGDKNSFIEYSKSLVDYIHAQHIRKEDKNSLNPSFKENIKSLSYFNGMLFVEKAKKKNSFSFLF